MPYMDPMGVLPSFLKEVIVNIRSSKRHPLSSWSGWWWQRDIFSSSDLYKTSKQKFWSETDLESKIHLEHIHNWLVVSTHLKNVRQNGNLPQIGEKTKNIWNHHLDNQQVVIDYHCSKDRCHDEKNGDEDPDSALSSVANHRTDSWHGRMRQGITPHLRGYSPSHPFTRLFVGAPSLHL